MAGESSFLGELAAAKRLPLEFLQDKLHVRDDGSSSIVIPYADHRGRAARCRYRHQGDPKFTWGVASSKRLDWDAARREGIYPPPIIERHYEIVPYGAWLYQQFSAERFVIVGEGESDAWACWFHDTPYLGIPGASNYRSLEIQHLGDVRKIFVAQEPGKAGSEFAKNIPARLWEIGFAGKIFRLQLGDVKDLCDLHIDDPAKFSQRLAGFMRDAHRINRPRQQRPKRERATVAPEDRLQIEAGLQRLDLRSVIIADIGPPDRAGKWLCPFHDDRSPSLGIFQSRAGIFRFRCFGCGVRGDAIDWIRNRKNFSFREACEFLGLEISSHPINRGMPYGRLPYKGIRDVLPYTEDDHLPSPGRGGDDFFDREKAFAIFGCPNQQKVVLRKKDDPSFVGEASIPCKKLRCLFCRARWISDRTEHYRGVLQNCDQVHVGFASSPSDWRKVRRRILQAGAQYLAIKRHSGQIVVFADQPAIGIVQTDRAAAIRLMEGWLQEVDERLVKPVLASDGWHHSRAHSDLGTRRYRLVCRSTAIKEKLLARCEELCIPVSEDRWHKHDIDVLSLTVDRDWTDKQVHSLFTECEADPTFVLIVGGGRPQFSQTPPENIRATEKSFWCQKGAKDYAEVQGEQKREAARTVG